MKVKRFSGYSESAPGGVTYQSGQVISRYVLDPIDKGVEYVKSTKLGDSVIVKKKSNRIKNITNPIKKYINSLKNK